MISKFDTYIMFMSLARRLKGSKGSLGIIIVGLVGGLAYFLFGAKKKKASPFRIL